MSCQTIVLHDDRAFYLEHLSDDRLDTLLSAVLQEQNRRLLPYGSDDFPIHTVLTFVVTYSRRKYTYAVVKADAFAWYTTAGVVFNGALPKRVTWQELSDWCASHDVPALYPQSPDIYNPRKRVGSR